MIADRIGLHSVLLSLLMYYGSRNSLVGRALDGNAGDQVFDSCSRTNQTNTVKLLD